MRVLHGVSRIKIKGALQRTTNSNQVAAFQIGRSFHHFGFNGPQTIVKTPNRRPQPRRPRPAQAASRRRPSRPS